MSQVVNLLVCVNSFVCGAICMLIALCIQPEVVHYMQKVYFYDFKKHRSEHEVEEGALFKWYLEHISNLVHGLDCELTNLHEKTYEYIPEESDAFETWTEVDSTMAFLKELVSKKTTSPK